MSRRRGRVPRITIVSEDIVRYDAVSAAVADTWRFLAGAGSEVRVLATGNELPWLPARVVGGLPELLLNPDFLTADLLVYHFGIWNPVYDALLLGNGHARQAAFFHNITPAELLDAKMRPVIARSFAQLHNLRRADRLWPVSRTNAEMLTALDFDPGRIDIIPLAVDRPAIARLSEKPPLPVELLFLGRIVPSKGLRDLVDAIGRIRGRDLPRFRLRLAGNLQISDVAYRDMVVRLIAERGLGEVVEFVGTVDDQTRDRMLQAAHILAIPSFHEGFCKPVVEALRAGCVPIGYAAHNLRFIADGLCRMVPPGDVAALAAALAGAIAEVADRGAPMRLDRGKLTAAQFDDAALAHIDQFRPERVAALVRRHAAALLAPTAPITAPAAYSAAGGPRC